MGENIYMKEVLQFVVNVVRGIYFRECAKIISIAEENDSTVTFISGDKEGNTNSILSLLYLGMKAGDEIVITVTGNSKMSTFYKIANILE